MADLEIELTPLQRRFLDSQVFITLFGGAAGGGKSYGLFIKYLLRCLKHPGYKALILRRTYPELQRSLIRLSLELTPKALGRYTEQGHIWKYVNGSRLEFGYCESEKDVYAYQSAEYDAIGFDESTHFSEYQVTYLMSRIRGVNDFPKSIDLATNPGNVGHMWHKNMIDQCTPLQPSKVLLGERKYDFVFLPAKATDNIFLMEGDPEYLQRLDALPEAERRMLQGGDWDVFAGQYYSMWRRGLHVVRPFEIPEWWRRFRCMDYGLDMTALLDVAIDDTGKLYVVREFSAANLVLAEAARQILEWSPPEIKYAYTVASPDLWNRRQDTGKSGQEILAANGLLGLISADNRRVPGWEALADYLNPVKDEQGGHTPSLTVFEGCLNLIRTLPALVRDDKRPNDVSDRNHEITHWAEALRYGVMSRPGVSRTTEQRERQRERQRKLSQSRVVSRIGKVG